jgi:hypothetical protein
MNWYFAILVLLIILVVGVVVVKKGASKIVCALPIVGKMVCKCPAGAVLEKGKCWGCAAGMQRTLDPASSATACSVPVLNSGAWCQKTTKNSSAMADLTGDCVACPSGFARVDSIAWNKSNACNGSCTKLYKGYPPWYSFEDGTSGQCYTCPTGMTRTVGTVVTAGNACEGDCPTIYPANDKHSVGFVDSTSASNNAPSCWTCPPGLTRTAAAVWDPKACGPTFFNGTKPAQRMGGNLAAAEHLGSMTKAAVSLAKWTGSATSSSPKI